MQFHYSYIAYIFGTSELLLLLAKRSKKGTVKSRRDKNSLIVLWIIITASLTAAGFAAGYENWAFPNETTVKNIGIAVAIVGFIIRWSAIIQLGKRFTVDVAITDAHTLKINGLYKIVRHPSYLGLMLIICGIALCRGNMLSCLVLIVPVFLALNYRMIVEEEALTAEFGDQYVLYKKNTARLIPGIY